MKNNRKRFSTLADGRFGVTNSGFNYNAKTNIITAVILIVSILNVAIHSKGYYIFNESFLDIINQIPPVSYIGDRSFQFAQLQGHYAFVEFMAIISIFFTISMVSICYICSVKAIERLHSEKKIHSPLFYGVVIVFMAISFVTFFLDHNTNDGGAVRFSELPFLVVAIVLQISWYMTVTYLLYIIFGDTPIDDTQS